MRSGKDIESQQILSYFRLEEKNNLEESAGFCTREMKIFVIRLCISPTSSQRSQISMSSPVKFPLTLQSKLYSVTHYPTYLTFSQHESKSDLAEGELCSTKGIYIIKQDLETFSSSGRHRVILQNDPILKIKNGQNPIMRI